MKHNKIVLEKSFKQFLLESSGNAVVDAIHIETTEPRDRYRKANKRVFSYDINYLGFSRDNASFISYQTKSRLEEIDKNPRPEYNSKNDEAWHADRRFHGRGGKVLRKLLTPHQISKLKDSDIESFVNLFKAKHTELYGDFEFRVVDGEDIRKYYYKEQYTEKFGMNGSLWGSCMRGRREQRFLDIYVENNVSMVIMVGSDGLIAGRALIWHGVDVEGVKMDVMDRIYIIRDSDTPLFKQYAEREGMLYKEKQSYTDKTSWIDGGVARDIEMGISIGSYEFDYYPYLDTFSYADLDCGWLYNHDGDGHTAELTETNGGGGEPEGMWCEYNEDYFPEEDVVECCCGRYCHTDEAMFMEYRHEWAYPDADVHYSDYNNDYIHIDDGVTTEDGDWVHQDDATYCDFVQEYHLNDDVVWSDYHDSDIPVRDAEEVDGEWIHQDHVEEYKEEQQEV